MSLAVDLKKRLKGFNLSIAFETQGEYLGILGASGSGKSMTLKCIAGVEMPDEGRIVLNGKVLFDSERKINLKPQDRNIGFLFQNYALFPHMTVEENIRLGLTCSESEKGQKVYDIIKSFHLEGLEKKFPTQLSGGQQQRTALARCVVYKPDILLLDEPFSALDSHLKEQLQNEMIELLKLYDGEVLMVTHSRDEAYNFCKNLVIIDKGKSVLMGNTKDIYNQPKLNTVAKLTGCKNISKCEILSPYNIYAVDWGVILETDEIVSPNIKYVGIRAHSFKMADAVDATSKKNTLECRIIKTSEALFEYNVFFEINNANQKNNNSVLLYKVSKEEWDNRKNKKDLYLKIPSKAILLLE